MNVLSISHVRQYKTVRAKQEHVEVLRKPVKVARIYVQLLRKVIKVKSKFEKKFLNLLF